MRYTSYVIILVLLFAKKTHTQTCCSGGVPLSNNLGLSNEGKGSFQIGINYDSNNLNTLNVGSTKLDDNSRKRVTNSILTNIGYSISDRLSLETLFTWVNQTRRITQFGNQDFAETSGIGDAIFLIKYAFPNIFKTNSTLNIGVGSKIPLGKSDIISDQGIQLTADLQPGSGAFDGVAWISFSKSLNFRPSARLSTNFTYRFTGVNDSYLNNTSTYEFGNVLQADIGFVDEIFVANYIINPGLVIKYRKSGFDKINNNKLPNTGGEWIFARAELTINLSSSLGITSKLELPIYSYVEGTQLTPTSRFNTGFIYKFHRKEKIIVK